MRKRNIQNWESPLLPPKEIKDIKEESEFLQKINTYLGQQNVALKEEVKNLKEELKIKPGKRKRNKAKEWIKRFVNKNIID